jgi:hypothetical protein
MNATASRSLTTDQEEEALFSILYGNSSLAVHLGGQLGSLTLTSTILGTVAALRAKVAALAQLKKNWDGEDGEPVSAETLATTTKVLEHISLVLSRKNILSSPSIRPFPDGSVFFKWVQGQRELTITIHGQNVDVQRWEPLDSYESQGLWEVSVDDTPEHIEWVLT